jgi:hypothetical protein
MVHISDFNLKDLIIVNLNWIEQKDFIKVLNLNFYWHLLFKYLILNLTPLN